MLKVTNPDNEKFVFVRVTDRGPHRRGRIIDLSWGAAKKLGILNKGVALVIVEKIDNYIVPFKPNNDLHVPEIDFSEIRKDYYIPDTWKNRMGKEDNDSVRNGNTTKNITSKEKPSANKKTQMIKKKIQKKKR